MTMDCVCHKMGGIENNEGQAEVAQDSVKCNVEPATQTSLHLASCWPDRMDITHTMQNYTKTVRKLLGPRVGTIL